MRSLAFAGAIIVGALSPTMAWGADGDADAGWRFATTHCARCHVVGDHNKFGGIGSTPSFQLLARPDDYLERFETFYARRPHPVFIRVPDVPKWSDAPVTIAEVEVTIDDIENIIAFVVTLRPD
jgi:mono/diheme cytochrome c family protein